MKKFLALLGLVALFGLGMSMSEMSSAPEEELNTTVVSLKGTIISTGACAELVPCGGGSSITLMGLPISYSVGDEVWLKGTWASNISICLTDDPVVQIGKIQYFPC